MPKVACIISDGFEDSEFRVPYDRMKKAGFEVELIGAKKGEEVKGKAGRETVKVEKAISEVKPDAYDALFIPGGYSPDHLRADERFVEFVKETDKLKKPIASICHGAQILMSAGLVRGRTLTAWKTVQHDLKLAGANVKDEPVVVDDNWITSRQPDDLEQFSEAVVKRLH
ncbi:MAG: type 1 glutamine amidotransferase domain-containing protein [Myxococcales bacterium]